MSLRATSAIVGLAGLLLGACSSALPDAGADGGGGSSGDGGKAAKGVYCTVTTTNGSTLCQGTSECPTAPVSPSTWMGCGYLISGNTLNLECECSGFLCPIGTATSCAEARALLQDQTLATVCGATAQGTCVNEMFASDASTTSPNCDQGCLSMCPSGDMTCIQYCGC